VFTQPLKEETKGELSMGIVGKIIVLALGIGLIITGIYWFYDAQQHYNNWWMTPAHRDAIANQAIIGVAIGIAGIIILVAFFSVMALKKSKTATSGTNHQSVMLEYDTLCRGCNKQVTPNTVFCISCGLRHRKEETSDIICSGCGNSATIDDSFCAICGNELEKGSADAFCSQCGNTVTAEDSICPICDNVLKENSAGAFCSGCGEPRMPNDTFCSSCGVELTKDFATSFCTKCGKELTKDEAFCKCCVILN